MTAVVVTESRVAVTTRMTVLTRLLAFTGGLFTLLAPYELLFAPKWQGFGVLTAFSAVIALGALALRMFFFAAVAGGGTWLSLDGPAGRVVYVAFSGPFSQSAPNVRRLDEVTTVRVRTEKWSDSADTYGLAMGFRDGGEVAVGDCPSRSQVEAYRDEVQAWLKKWTGDDIRPSGE